MRPVTLDDVAKFPRPGMALPGRLAFSPDGKAITFLQARGEGLERVLWTLDPATGRREILFAPSTGVTDENVSREEALRRERQRLRETGVTHYSWSETGNVLLVPLRGEAWILRDGVARSVAKGAVDPRLSPDGSRVAFVRDGDVWVVDTAAGRETRLTSDAAPGVTNGLPEFAAQEEMGRHHGLWWSRDGLLLAFQQVDERHLPIYTIPHAGKDAVEFEHHRYPFAGAENAKFRLGIVPAAGGAPVWMETAGFEYLARVDWHPDGRLFVQLQTRDQRRLELKAFDPKTGKGTTLLVEESPSWINLHNDLRFVAATGEFVWASERTGFKHLYLHKGDGALVRAITSGEWPVDAVEALDAKGRRVAFTGSRTPAEKHLFVASLDGGEPEQLSREPGFHDAVFSPDFAGRIETFESRSTPPTIRLRGAVERTIHEPPAIELNLRTPELFSFVNREGTTLHGMIYKPDRLPAPLIVDVYGGPGAQRVHDSWVSRVNLRAQYLVQRGFAVMVVDNRGSGRRGQAFKSALCEKMGTVEVRDQVDAVAFARSKGWVDRDRVGVYGWSYGGYMTLMCLLKAPDVFKAGVSGAPVTHWDGYDTHYTERFMRTPQANPAGYREGSVMEFAGNLKGKLLLVHGMLDENVHFRHTARFVDALIKANKPYEILLYPNERHMPRSEKDRRNMEERIAEFFEKSL